MKITCTTDEMKTIIENCYGNRMFFADTCERCALSKVCKDGKYEGISVDFELIKGGKTDES